jgi:type III secretion protein J
VPGTTVLQPPPPEPGGIWPWIALAAVVLVLGGGWVLWRRPAWLPAGLAKKLPTVSPPAGASTVA